MGGVAGGVAGFSSALSTACADDTRYFGIREHFYQIVASMATPLRPRAVPQCLNCLRRSALGGSTDGAAQSSALRQQVRGKKKMVNNSQFVTVRLRKDVKAYGRKGRDAIEIRSDTLTLTDN